jgi:thermitase
MSRCFIFSFIFLLLINPAFSKSYLWLTEKKKDNAAIIKSFGGKILSSSSLSIGELIHFKAPKQIVGLSGIIEENFQFQTLVSTAPLDIHPKQKSIPMQELQWGLENRGNNEPIRTFRRSPVRGVIGADIHALEAWAITKGSSQIKIAVVDTGIDITHPNLKQNIWHNLPEQTGTPGVDDDQNGFIDDINGWNFVSNNPSVQDDMGHGTHCAGIIGGKHLKKGIKGVMDRVQLIPVKFLDKKGRGSLEQTIKAMDYAINLQPHIINASWGSSRKSEILLQLIQVAKDKKIFIVAAAGNLRGRNNDLSPTYPASYQESNVLSVSAHNAQDYHSAFSSWGPKSVHLAGPGTNIISTFKNQKYKVWSGTSMAAPFLSGGLGIYLSLQKNPSEINVPHLKERLLDSTVYSEHLIGKNITEGRFHLMMLLAN